MTLVLEDPGAVLDYLVDWGADYLAAGEALSASSWSVSPAEVGGVTVAGSDFTPATATVKVSGGLVGHVYMLTNRVQLQGGREDERSITVRVEER